MATKLPKKICPLCRVEKTIKNGFYKSSSPLFSNEGCVPICISCVKKEVVNEEDGTINTRKLKRMCQKLDKPYYMDDLNSAYEQFGREHGFMPKEDIAKHGNEIIGLYFKNINSLRQTKNKSYSDSEKDGFIHQNSNKTVLEKDKISKEHSDEKFNDNEIIKNDIKNKKIFKDNKEQFEVTQEILDLFGEGYSIVEYKNMYEKYEKLKLNYSLQTSLHQEALATYVRFKVKEEEATARGNVDEAKKWYEAAQSAASNGKLMPKQLTQADLQGGINSFSEIFKAVEQAVDVIPILPRFKHRPNDACDFIIWCYINYARDLQGLPACEYEDVYKFYDKKKEEYISQYGDPYGIFDDDPSEDLRPNIKKFITLPKDYEDGDN